MTERSAEQPPVEGRLDHQDTARIPLAQRLQRRITAASEEQRSRSEAPRESSRILPPLPPELAEQRTEQRPPPPAESQSARAAAPLRPIQPEPAARAVQGLPDQTAEVAAVPPATAPIRRTRPATAAAPR